MSKSYLRVAPKLSEVCAKVGGVAPFPLTRAPPPAKQPTEKAPPPMITAHPCDELPEGVAACLAKRGERTVLLVNYDVVDALSGPERLEMLNNLFAEMYEPSPVRLDELAVLRRRNIRAPRLSSAC